MERLGKPPMQPAVPVQPDLLVNLGAIAQLGEHLLCKQGVVGSIPTGSTTLRRLNVTAHTERLLAAGHCGPGAFFDNLDVASV